MRSESAMAGYLPDEATAAAFDDGWYRTGDVGWLEAEGWVHLTDRCKEMIKVSGFQVAPAEIEAVLHGHPAVLDCAVFGVADERAGRGPGRRSPARSRAVTSARRAAGTGGGLARHVQAPARGGARRCHPANPVGQGAAPHAARRMGFARRAAIDESGLKWTSDSRPSRWRCATRPSRWWTGWARGSVADLDDTERMAKLDAAVTASGWRELRAASDEGGPWASAVEVAVVAEELGRGLADVPFFGPTMAADLRRLAGAGAGDCTRDDGAHGRISPSWLAVVIGRLPERGLAVDAAGAASALVLLARQPARLGHGWAVGSLPSPTDGAADGVDLTRPSCPALRGRRSRRCPNRAGRSSPRSSSHWHSLGLAVACADLVGVMRGAIALAADYARERKQYGATIGSFQAVQHLLADAQVAMEGSRSIALHAAWAVDALPGPDALAAASSAKAYCARAARAVCETAIQVHGGIGNTWECLAHVYLRRALLSTELLGGIGISLDRVLASRGIGGDDGLR